MTSSEPLSRWVLVIEDDDDVRETVVEIVQDHGYTVLGVPHGRAALEALAEQHAPCLIFLDLMMPVMDGWQFLEALRAKPLFRTTPVVVMSAYTERAVGLSVDRLVAKPVDLMVLVGCLKEYCG